MREWPDPIHRAYTTLLAQRRKHYVEYYGWIYPHDQSRSMLRKLARKIAYKGEKDDRGTR